MQDTATIIADKFIKFFTHKDKAHRVIPSSPLIPENDPTVLFITAGMHPLVPYLLGEKHPLGDKLVNIQKCVRTDDIDEVGDLRHFTFFEMLGNWSLGNYFKKEAIKWSLEFITDKKWLNLNKEKIYVSVFAGDNNAPPDKESIIIWKDVFKSINIQAETGIGGNKMEKNQRIFSYPAASNWWGPAGITGPCGPDTEIFYDTGLPFHNKDQYPYPCHINCNCGRFLEIWNNVFMEYNKQKDSSFTKLTQQNVDTGMGMERIVSLIDWINGKIDSPDPFLTGLFSNTVFALEKMTGVKYHNKAKFFRIICDHIRSAVFMTADGVTPTNKERGYILRRLIRRLLRSWHALGVKDYEIDKIAKIVINDYQKRYPLLRRNKTQILKTLTEEAQKFQVTLKKGLKELEKSTVINEQTAFNLFQSFGFPPELTVDIAKEKGITLSFEKIQKQISKHQEISRSAAKGSYKGGLADNSETTTKLHTATHLLQEALRRNLGDHTVQKGSHITFERLRFDFSHDKPLTNEQIKNIEDTVNQCIKKNMQVHMKVVDFKEAQKRKALTVPQAQYPEKVKIYQIGDFSLEVCGGPHVAFTGEMGLFKIIKEESAAKGIRRIYARLNK